MQKATKQRNNGLRAAWAILPITLGMSQLAKIRIEEGSQLSLQVRILIARSSIPELYSVRHLRQDRLESTVLRWGVIQKLHECLRLVLRQSVSPLMSLCDGLIRE